MSASTRCTAASARTAACRACSRCLGIPYTHSGVLASALAMHKERAKDVMRPAGVPVADAEVVTRREAMSRHVLPPPYVVKPVAEGSSVGVVIVDAGANAPPRGIGERRRARRHASWSSATSPAAS